MRADFHVLVDRRKAAEDHPVADLHVSAQRGTVGEHGLAADLTIVADMRIRHEEVVVADTRDTFVVRRAAVYRAALAMAT